MHFRHDRFTFLAADLKNVAIVGAVDASVDDDGRFDGLGFGEPVVWFLFQKFGQRIDPQRYRVGNKTIGFGCDLV